MQVKLALEQTTKAQLGRTDIALIFLQLRRYMWWVVNATPRPLYRREIAGTHCRGGWVEPRAGWAGVENLATTGIRSQDRPALSESLYRVSYPDRRLEEITRYKPLLNRYDFL